MSANRPESYALQHSESCPNVKWQLLTFSQIKVNADS
jgi:hypothetical protein